MASCSETVYNGAYGLGSGCGAPVAMQDEDGKSWCRHHSPEGKKAAAANRQRKFEAEQEWSRARKRDKDYATAAIAWCEAKGLTIEDLQASANPTD